MSKKKALTRILIEQMGSKPKRLLSVRESSSGERLVLTTHLRGAQSFFKYAPAEVSEFKHTLHPAVGKPLANQVHQTTIFTNGGRSDLYLLSEAYPLGRFQPIYAISLDDMSSQQDYEPHPKDDAFIIGPFDPKEFRLNCSVWYGPANAPDPYLDTEVVSALKICFKRYSLFIIYCYGADNGMSNPNRFKNYSTSSAERLTPTAIAAGHKAGLANGVEAPEVLQCALRDFFELLGPGTIGNWNHPTPVPTGGYAVRIGPEPKFEDTLRRVVVGKTVVMPRSQ